MVDFHMAVKSKFKLGKVIQDEKYGQCVILLTDDSSYVQLHSMEYGKKNILFQATQLLSYILKRTNKLILDSFLMNTNVVTLG